MFIPTYKTPNKGFLGVLHDWDPPWGPPPQVIKVKSALCVGWRKSETSISDKPRVPQRQISKAATGAWVRKQHAGNLEASSQVP